jgi:thiol-disulfide isomerase/thioredoxin
MRAFRLLPVLLVAAAAVLPAGAQMIPPDPVLKDFEPIGDYQLEMGGVPQPAAHLYRSQSAGAAVLVTGQGLAASYLISPRDRAVMRIEPAKVVVGGDGVAFILQGAPKVKESPFAIEGRDLTFTLAGKPARLREKPYLLGLHPGSDLLQDAGYAFRAKQYKPSPAMLKTLRAAVKGETVRVYFGSWCPHCQQMVPRILRVQNELAGANLKFEFYGLPSPFNNEPEAKKMGIEGVPTGVVFRGGKEIGRIDGGDWGIPELAIQKVVGGTAASR